MIGRGLLRVSTIDSKDTTPHLYSHRATGFEYEGVKSLAQVDRSGTMSGVQTLNLGSCDVYTLHGEPRGGVLKP